MKPRLAKTKERAVASEGPISSRKELEQVEERLVIGPNVVYETIRRQGDEELARAASGLAWSGLAAGLSMGFSFIAEGLLMARLPDSPWRSLVSKAGYCVGFLIVILGRQQLFTENTLTVILPLLLRKDAATFVRVLRLWGTVLSANLVGTFLIALCLARVALLNAPTQAALLEIGKEHFGAGFALVMVRAIFAGWLIALMVWLLPGAESAKVTIIIIITYLVGLAGFNHIVAGSTTALFLVANNTISFGTYLTQFFAPHYWATSSEGSRWLPLWAMRKWLAGRAERRAVAFRASVQGLCPIFARVRSAYGRSKDVPSEDFRRSTFLPVAHRCWWRTQATLG